VPTGPGARIQAEQRRLWCTFRTRHALSLLAAVPLLVLAAAMPASAHGQGSYVTAVTSVRPRVPGLVVTVSTDGSWVYVTNSSPEPVLVLRYEDEPYLRVSADGVWENTRSATAYLNGQRTSGGVPADVDSGAAPRWRRMSARARVRFHDLRVPQTTRKTPAAPIRARVISKWTMPLRSGDTRVTVGGTLRRQPAPEQSGWVLLALLLGNGSLLLVGFAAWSDRESGDRAAASAPQGRDLCRPSVGTSDPG
jgi:hypothetical protein